MLSVRPMDGALPWFISRIDRPDRLNEVLRTTVGALVGFSLS